MPIPILNFPTALELLFFLPPYLASAAFVSVLISRRWDAWCESTSSLRGHGGCEHRGLSWLFGMLYPISIAFGMIAAVIGIPIYYGRKVALTPIQRKRENTEREEAKAAYKEARRKQVEWEMEEVAYGEQICKYPQCRKPIVRRDGMWRDKSTMESSCNDWNNTTNCHQPPDRLEAAS